MSSQPILVDNLAMLFLSMIPQSSVYRNLLECHLCDGKLKKPKALPCLHSFCHECLRQYIPLNIKGTQTTFPCPRCLRSIKSRVTSKPVEEWADLFPDNFFLENILTSSKLKSILNSTLEESILITTQSVASARYQLFCRSLSLRKHRNIPSAYSRKSLHKERVTKSVTFAPLPALEDGSSTKPLKFESNNTGETTCSKVLRSSLKASLGGKTGYLGKKVQNRINELGSNELGSNEGSNPSKSKEISVDLLESFQSILPGIEAVGEPARILFTHKGFLLIADPLNWNLKKFSREGHLLDLLKLNSEPGDMALISNHQVAVPLFKKNEIIFISFNTAMKITGRLSVNKQYHKLSPGLGWTLVGLSLCPLGPPSVDVFYYTGEIVQNILPHIKGNEANLATTLSADMIICSSQDRVLSAYDSEGDQKFKWHNTDERAIVDPKGLCTDKDGFIYVADGKMNKIHRLTQDGEYDCEFLTAFDGIENPAAICVDSLKQEIVVAQSNGEIKMFSFR